MRIIECILICASDSPEGAHAQGCSVAVVLINASFLIYVMFVFSNEVNTVVERSLVPPCTSLS